MMFSQYVKHCNSSIAILPEKRMVNKSMNMRDMTKGRLQGGEKVIENNS